MLAHFWNVGFLFHQETLCSSFTYFQRTTM